MYQACFSHFLVLSCLFPHPCPMSSQASQPVPTLLGSDFHPGGPMFCTNSYAISSSIYFIIGDRLINARLAKSFGRKKGLGLLKCRGKKDVWAEVKGRQGRRRKWRVTLSTWPWGGCQRNHTNPLPRTWEDPYERTPCGPRGPFPSSPNLQPAYLLPLFHRTICYALNKPGIFTFLCLYSSCSLCFCCVSSPPLPFFTVYCQCCLFKNSP